VLRHIALWFAARSLVSDSWRASEPPGMGRRDQTVTRTVSLLASIAALAIAIAPPLTSLLAARDRLDVLWKPALGCMRPKSPLSRAKHPGFGS
jgi:hypothetical protein